MSKLFELFAGEYIRITLSKGLKQTIQHAGSFKTIDSLNEVEGYLNEECTDNFYLGNELGEINIAVNKFEYSKVEVIDPNEEKKELLNEFTELGDKSGGMN